MIKDTTTYLSNFHNEPIMGEDFINAISDFGFKKIMSDTEILTDFINTFTPDDFPQIVHAELLPQESLGLQENQRKLIFDVKAKDNEGRIFIIEVQKISQKFFVKRSLFYNAREISNQGEKGNKWKYSFQPVHNISVLNFTPDEPWAEKLYNSFSMLDINTHKKLSDDMSQTYLLLDFLNKDKNKQNDRRKQWCYILKNIVYLKRAQFTQADWAHDKIYNKITNSLAKAALTKKELEMVNEEEKALMDYYAILASHKEDAYALGEAKGRAAGLAEGEAKGRTALAKKLKAKGMPLAEIAELTELPLEVVKNL